MGESWGGCHHSGASAGSDLRTVYVECHIADPMESVFDAPLAAVEFQYPLGGGLCGGQAGDTIDRFGGFLVFPEMRDVAADAKDLTHIREFQVVVQLFAGPY
jgi:hypothetical protein